MPDEHDTTLADEVGAAAEALRSLAADPQQSKLLVEAFRAQDHETFRGILDRFQLVGRCDLVCDWLCSKHCVLRCQEFCGPSVEPVDVDLAEWARTAAKLAADVELLTRLCDAFVERDRDRFGALVEEAGLERYCAYLCQWICHTWCTLVCERLCRPERPVNVVACRQLVVALRQAGRGVERLVATPAVLKDLVAAVRARDCIVVRELLQRAGLAGHCRWICGWICAWRCVRLCFVLCRRFPFEVVRGELDEIQDFTHALSELPDDALGALADAVETEDEQRFAAVIEQFGLGRYCHQVCAWLCHLVCRRFCICVCRPGRARPWFTHVGHFHIYSDIDPTTGLTNKAVLGHGGPGFGFHNCLELRGYCPADSPIAPGTPMKYRFVVERLGTRTPLTPALLCDVHVGSRTIYWDLYGTGPQATFQTVRIAGSGETPDVTPPPDPLPPAGSPWPEIPVHVIVPDSDGWIEVDPGMLAGGFDGALIGFDTRALFAGGAPMTTVSAGTAVPAGEQESGVDVAIVFEATRVGGPAGPPDHSNTLARLRINNWEEVSLLDLTQFHAEGATPCSELTSDLDIEYTVDHELMRAWSISIDSAAATYTPGVLPSGTSTRPSATTSPAGVHHEGISSWDSCSYTVELRTRRALTDGLTDDPTRVNDLTFCKA